MGLAASGGAELALLRLLICRVHPMGYDARASLAEIATVGEMVEAFAEEDQCRRLMGAMVWPRGRICQACPIRESIALAGYDQGRRAAIASINARAARSEYLPPPLSLPRLSFGPCEEMSAVLQSEAYASPRFERLRDWL
jgi:hypothetical protein